MAPRAHWSESTWDQPEQFKDESEYQYVHKAEEEKEEPVVDVPSVCCSMLFRLVILKSDAAFVKPEEVCMYFVCVCEFLCVISSHVDRKRHSAGGS